MLESQTNPPPPKTCGAKLGYAYYVVHWPCCSDGLISYDELLSYFLSANTSLRERFTHQFAEHTFLGNAVCEHCKGMVSWEWPS
jgi:hypothetical protein